jgi:adenylate cyclase
MGQEIERKFLLSSDAWRDQVSTSSRLIQGYLLREPGTAIRVRVVGDKAEINIKHTLDGISRLEYEYDIPLADAREILERVAQRPLIDKVRHLVPIGDHVWEIDEFAGDNAGLIMAEIELEHADEAFEHPDWLGSEVSLDERYYNSNLSRHPFSTW